MIQLDDLFEYDPLDLLPNSLATYRGRCLRTGAELAVELRQWRGETALPKQAEDLNQAALSLDLLRLERLSGDYHYHYFIRPYFFGGSWAELPALQAEEADKMTWIKDLAEVLSYLHQNNYVCQNLEPAHILLDNNQIKLIKYDHKIKLSWEVFTSYACLAPEQFEADYQPDVRTDIWAFGVCCLWLFRAQMPFGLKAAQLPNRRIKERILEDEPPFWLADLPWPLNDLTRACLQKDPNLRPQSMREVLAYWQATPAQTKEKPLAEPSQTKPQTLQGRSKDVPYFKFVLLMFVVVFLAYGLRYFFSV